MTSSSIPAARSQYLLDLLAQVPDPRKRRGRRHSLAGLLAVGIAAVIAGSRSFAAIGQWAADAGPDVLAVLGAERGPAEESTFRRAFALVSADVLDRVLGAWLHTRAVQAGGRLVIAIDGKTVRGAKDKAGKAPHLVAALAHGIGAVLGQAAVTARSNEIPAVRDLLKAFTSLAGAVITIDALHTQGDTAQVITGRGADYVMAVKGNMPALYRQLKKLPRARIPGPQQPPPPYPRIRAGLWKRCLGGGLAVWVPGTLVTYATRSTALLPTLVLLGSFLVPVTFVLWAYERHGRDLGVGPLRRRSGGRAGAAARDERCGREETQQCRSSVTGKAHGAHCAARPLPAVAPSRPGREARWWPPTSPAARTTPSAIAAKATVCSTTWPSRRPCSCATA